MGGRPRRSARADRLAGRRDLLAGGGAGLEEHRRGDRGRGRRSGRRTAAAGAPAVAQVEDPGLGQGDQRLAPREGEQDQETRGPAEQHVAQPVRAQVHRGETDAERGHRGRGGQPAAGGRGGGQIGQDSPGHDRVGGVAAGKYIAAETHLVRADDGRVVRAEPAHAELGGADRDVQQQQRGAQGQQRAQRVLPPRAPAQPGRDHHRGRAALAEDHVVVHEPVDARPLLVRPEEHDLPVEPDQPGRGHDEPHDRQIEGQGRREQHDPVPAHLRHIDVGRPFRFTVQPREHPVQTGEVSFGTHPIDVTASECGSPSNQLLCDDDVMWESSQEQVYFRGFRNPGGLRPSIPLIMPGSSFMALMN